VPELPEVETVRLGLNQVTLEQPILDGEVLLARSIAYPISTKDFLAGLREASICQWHRRGKYLLAKLQRSDSASSMAERSPAGWLGVHLRMTGQLLWVRADEPVTKHCRVRLLFAQNRELRFVDQRTFGQLWWVPPAMSQETVVTGLTRLGPEPFSPEFSVTYLAQQLQSRQRPIKNALLDQRLVAGVGNIYADEALFLSQIHPQTHCSLLGLPDIERLHTAVIKVLQNAIEARGTTFSDFRDVAGVNGNYGGIAWVYDREGEACRVCATSIQRIKLAGRSAHFCPQCQS
jgi:formamidopyrimidine-DNA glycosylase